MGLRFAPGPVFGLECLAVPRRWQLFAGRMIFVAFLLTGLWMIWAPSGKIFTNHQELALIGQQFFGILVITQLIVVMLLAPASTAGSICVEKVRGTLHHVFVTDLADREIVLGKLSARLLSVFSLMACGIPVVALSGLLGGVDYGAIAGAYVVTAGVAVVSCSLAMLFSVWVRKPHHALLPTYVLLGLWTILYVFVAEFMLGRGATPQNSDVLWILRLANPFALAMAPSFSPAEARWYHPFVFLIGTVAFSALFVTDMTQRLRSVVIGQADRKVKRQRADAPLRILDYIPGPSLDGNPVLWREWHRKRPTKWTGRFWTLYGFISFLASALAIFAYFTNPGGIGPDQLAAAVNGYGVAIGLLLLTISATTSLAEERDRGSLDVILTTPLSTATILWGKWWGTFAMAPRLAILPFWVSCGMALVSGHWLAPFAMLALILAYSAFITGLGLALATWISRLGRVIGTGIFLYLMISGGLYFGHGVLRSWDAPTLPQTIEIPGFARRAIPYGYYAATRPDWDWLYLGIPLLGIAETTEWAGRLPVRWQTVDPEVYVFGANEAYGRVLMWIIIYAGISAWLMLVSIASFDRFLDRMTTDVRLDTPPRFDPTLPRLPEPNSSYFWRRT